MKLAGLWGLENLELLSGAPVLRVIGVGRLTAYSKRVFIYAFHSVSSWIIFACFFYLLRVVIYLLSSALGM